ncbi:MAG: TonB-dependent receptor [Tannerella sp.]|jgi:hypothetical protein|nr:TonB-dependent receptor [Tannerella sp.]
MKKFLLLLPLFLPLLVSAQLKLEGKIVDKANGQGIASAIVSLVNADDDIVTHCLSDRNGYFKISHTGDTVGSLSLVVRILSYKTEIIPVSGSNFTMQVSLEATEFNLKEVVVKSPSIYGKEDTTVYNVGAFQTQQDRKIGDILKKLPGIEVSDNGAIKHKGEAINRFYIEGLDLLGGKYGIATNNVPVDEVSQVEVIEFHQPVKMLNNVAISEQSAINLKLKNKKMIHPVGNIKAGGGYEPERVLALLDAFAMQAGQKSQLITMLKGNNTGNDIAAEMQNHYSDGDEAPPLNSILSARQVSGSSFKNERYLFNKTGIASLNNLRKTSETAQLRINLDYQNDTRTQSDWMESAYFLGDSIFMLNEIRSLETGNNLLDGAVTYTDNAPERYFNNTLKAGARWNSSVSTVQNRNSVSEDYRITSLNVSNKLNYSGKLEKRYWNISSFVRYTSLPQKLNVETDLPPEMNARQTIYRSGFYTNNGTSLNLPVFSSRIQMNINLEAAFDDLNSDLSHPLFTNSFTNRLKSDNLIARFSPSYSFNNRNVTFNISSPFYYEYLKVNDNILKESDMRNLFYCNPQMNFAYSWNPKWRLHLRYHFINRTGSIVDYPSSFILTTYRTLSIKEGLLSKSQTQSVNANLDFKNPLAGLFFNSMFGFSAGKNNLMTQQYFQNLLAITNNIEAGNSAQTLVSSIYAGKRIDALRSSLSLSILYNSMSSKRNQQQQTYPFLAENWTVSPKLNTQITRYLVVEYQAFLINQGVTVKQPGIADFKSSNTKTSNQLKIFIFPNNKLEVKLSGDYIYSEITKNIQTKTFFMDMGLSYKIKQIELTLAWDNIFNSKEYAYTTFSGLDTYHYGFRLRPNNLLLTVGFKY